MNDITGWLSSSAGVATLVTLAYVTGLVRLHVHMRHRLQIERERSARSRARTAGLTEAMLGCRSLRLVERDGDGERTIEIGRPHHVAERDAA